VLFRSLLKITKDNCTGNAYVRQTLIGDRMLNLIEYDAPDNPLDILHFVRDEEKRPDSKI
jgi:hypothetical protein